MKSNYLHHLFLIGILTISNFLYAQKITNKEEDNLKFQTHFFEALKQKAIKNYSKAIESLEKCYEIDSLSTAVEFEFSKNYLHLKKYFEAKIFINKALVKEPKNNYLLIHKVTVFKAQFKINEAIETQLQLVKLQPKYNEELVLLYLQNKNFKKAKKLIAKIEKNALSTTRIKSFKKYLESLKTLNKTNNKQHNVNVKNANLEILKKSYLEKKEYKILHEILRKEANGEFFEMLYADSKKALELFPAQPYLYKMNALALNKLRKYNEAIYVLTIGIDFVIDNKIMEAEFYEQFSISYKGLNNTTKALKYKQKAEALRKGI